MKDFPPESLSPYAIELMTADEFLVNQFHLDADTVIAKLEAQAAKKRSTLTDLVQLLSKTGAPKFAQLVSEDLDG